MTESILLWEGGAPGALGTLPEDKPTLELYPVANSGGTVVVCPGGGYQGLAPHEAEPIAQWLNAEGISAVVLRYRLGPRYHHPAPLDDALRAIRTVRARGAGWGMGTGRVGILGFSAGGHLTSTAGTHWVPERPDAEDPLDRPSSRPDAMVLIYPVISLQRRPHMGSVHNLLGNPPSEELVRVLSSEDQVTETTPPAFLVHGMDDAGVPVEHSLLFLAALRARGVGCEALLYQHGAHGFGLGGDDAHLSRWPALCGEWLRAQGF